jgi:integrase
MKMALTDKWLKAHLKKPQEKRFEKAHREGLSVRISLNGAITFQYRYYLRDRKKYDRATIGYYPETSLAAATAELPRLKVMLAEGKNPKLELASNRIYESEKLTLNQLFDKWYEGHCRKNKVAHLEHLRSYEIHLKPKLGKLVAENITRPVFLEVLNPLIEIYPSIAERLIVNLKQMYSWARIQQIADANPLYDITAKNLGIEKGQDTRFFTEKEIGWFYKGLDKTRIEEKNKIYIELSFHYACRPRELRLAEIEHVHLDIGHWVVPWENHKTGKKTRQPLVRPIIPEIKVLWERAIELSGSHKWIFTNRGTSAQIDKSAIPASIRCIENYWRKKITVNGESIKYDSFCAYTLRKTARTNFSDFGEWAVCEKMIGHKLPGESDKYDYNTYAEKMRPIYQKWYDYTQQIRKGNSKITNISSRVKA